MTCIELADVAAPEFLHEAGNGSRLWWCGQQMDVIVHQYVCVQPAAGIEQRLAQQCEVALPVVVVEKAGETIVPALDDVLRDKLADRVVVVWPSPKNE